jgi:cystathionine beta-lyase family protein involved in aluminum resistance
MNDALTSLLEQAETALARGPWRHFEAVCHATTQRVVEAMTNHRLSEEHFYSVTGYGHNDLGRDALDAIFAHSLQAASALVRPQIVSGTHAISVGLRACLSPGQTMLVVTGPPYDTLEEVIGIRGDSTQSLMAKGIHYQVIDLIEPQGQGTVRLEWSSEETSKIDHADMLYIQRSKGYGLRPTLTEKGMRPLLAALRQANPQALIFVDNCYGEFVEPEEPTAYGADLMAGSLIKNPGGGLAPTGGYLAGRTDLIETCGEVLTCPGVGTHGGYTFNLTRTLLQGLYLAPNVVFNALKGMSLAAYLLEHSAGIRVSPRWDEARGDIIQLLHLGNAQALETVCGVIQAHSPVNSHLTPIASHAPGYDSALIMAGGTFMDGSSVELSADGPLREPYMLFLQGGLVYSHTRWVLQALIPALQGILHNGN